MELKEWIFPEFDEAFVLKEQTAPVDIVLAPAAEAPPEIIAPNPIEIALQELNQCKEEAQQLYQHLEGLKAEYETKLTKLEHIIDNINQTSHLLDEEFIATIYQLIQTLSQRLIYKE